MKEYTFYGTVSVKKKISITAYAADYETAHEKAMGYLEKTDDIDHYITDQFEEEVEFDFDEYESTVIHLLV